MADTNGQTDLRGENIESAVKGFALQEYKMKQVFQETSSSAWIETFYQETATELTASGAQSLAGTPRGSQFHTVEPSWTKVQGVHTKFAAEGYVYLEDKLTDAIDVQARTLIRVSRAIASAVDNFLYDTLSAASSIGTAAAVSTWDNATVADRDPIRDLLKGVQNIVENNYDMDNIFTIMNPKNYTNLMMNSKVINNPSFKTADVVSNGRVGQIVGTTIIVTNSANSDEVMMIKAQRAATLRTAVNLTTAVIEDQGIKFTIRAWEILQPQITDAKCIYVITNTEA